MRWFQNSMPFPARVVGGVAGGGRTGPGPPRTRKRVPAPRTRRAHVHCLTGRGDAAARRRARRAGCEGFLTKPVDADTVLGVLRRQVTGPSSQWVTGLSGAGVQELADWLENNGCRPVEV